MVELLIGLLVDSIFEEGDGLAEVSIVRGLRGV